MAKTISNLQDLELMEKEVDLPFLLVKLKRH